MKDVTSPSRFNPCSAALAFLSSFPLSKIHFGFLLQLHFHGLCFDPAGRKELRPNGQLVCGPFVGRSGLGSTGLRGVRRASGDGGGEFYGDHRGNGHRCQQDLADGDGLRKQRWLLQALTNWGVSTGSTANGPRLDYRVKFASTGTYFVWVRIRGGSANDNAIHAGLNGTAATIATGSGMSTGSSFNSFIWTKAVEGGSTVSFRWPRPAMPMSTFGCGKTEWSSTRFS